MTLRVLLAFAALCAAALPARAIEVYGWGYADHSMILFPPELVDGRYSDPTAKLEAFGILAGTLNDAAVAAPTNRESMAQEDYSRQAVDTGAPGPQARAYLLEIDFDHFGFSIMQPVYGIGLYDPAGALITEPLVSYWDNDLGSNADAWGCTGPQDGPDPRESGLGGEQVLPRAQPRPDDYDESFYIDCMANAADPVQTENADYKRFCRTYADTKNLDVWQGAETAQTHEDCYQARLVDGGVFGDTCWSDLGSQENPTVTTSGDETEPDPTSVGCYLVCRDTFTLAFSGTEVAEIIVAAATPSSFPSFIGDLDQLALYALGDGQLPLMRIGVRSAPLTDEGAAFIDDGFVWRSTSAPVPAPAALPLLLAALAALAGAPRAAAALRGRAARSPAPRPRIAAPSPSLFILVKSRC